MVVYYLKTAFRRTQVRARIIIFFGNQLLRFLLRHPNGYRDPFRTLIGKGFEADNRAQEINAKEFYKKPSFGSAC
jgi:hypothetical protein